jgi:hypothetical protein
MLGHELAAVALQDLPAPPLAASKVGNDLPAHPEDERPQDLRVAQLSLAQAVAGHEDHVLDQVVGRASVSQVTQAVEADARSEATEQLDLGLGIASGQPDGHVAVASGLEARDFGQGAISITQPSERRCNGRPGRYTSPSEEGAR